MKKIGDEELLNLALSATYDKEFPLPYKTILIEKGFLTKVEKKKFYELGYPLLLKYNDRRFQIKCDLIDKPFYYTPDFVLVSNDEMLWIEVKNNTGFFGKWKTPPTAWNFRKAHISGWCKNNNIKYLELRWNLPFRTWDDFSESNLSKCNKKLSGKVLSPYSGRMVNKYERNNEACPLTEFADYFK